MQRCDLTLRSPRGNVSIVLASVCLSAAMRRRGYWMVLKLAATMRIDLSEARTSQRVLLHISPHTIELSLARLLSRQFAPTLE